MNSSENRIPSRAAALFENIQRAYAAGENPVVTQRKTWFEFVIALREAKPVRVSPQEFYAFLSDTQGWRNDLAQNLITDYEGAMELMDYLAARGR